MNDWSPRKKFTINFARATFLYAFRNMAIVTLISDWGLCNHYVATVKGTLLKQIPNVTIVDISHEVPCFDLEKGCFILRNAYQHFPEGTIHLVALNTEAGSDTPHVVVKHDGHYFIGADNGIFAIMFDEKPSEAVEIDTYQDSNYFTFPTRDLFVKIAARIARGEKLEEIGQPYKSLKETYLLKPVVYDDRIIGRVIFVDNYHNFFINIDQETFKSSAKGRKFNIDLRSQGLKIDRFQESYGDVVEGEVLALFSATGYLEIAINKGKASGLLGFKVNDLVTINFMDAK